MSLEKENFTPKRFHVLWQRRYFLGMARFGHIISKFYRPILFGLRHVFHPVIVLLSGKSLRIPIEKENFTPKRFHVLWQRRYFLGMARFGHIISTLYTPILFGLRHVFQLVIVLLSGKS